MFPSRPDASRRRALWWAIIRHDAPQILNSVLVSLLLLGVAALGIWNYNRTREDLEGALPQQAEGVVTAVGYRPATETNPDPYRLAYLAIDDRTLVLDRPFSTVTLQRGVPLQIGQPVRFTYRMGKSGTWYLDRVEPLPRER